MIDAYSGKLFIIMSQNKNIANQSTSALPMTKDFSIVHIYLFATCIFS